MVTSDGLNCATHATDIKDGPREFPWVSSHGCEITDDGWILSSDGKRLLTLHPIWQSPAVQRAQNGQFITLPHGLGGPPEPVILDFEPVP